MYDVSLQIILRNVGPTTINGVTVSLALNSSLSIASVTPAAGLTGGSSGTALIILNTPIRSRSTMVVIAKLKVAANAVPKSLLSLVAKASYRGISTKPKERKVRVVIK